MRTVWPWLLLVIGLQAILVLVMRRYRQAIDKLIDAVFRPVLDWFDRLGATESDARWNAVFRRIVDSKREDLAEEVHAIVEKYGVRGAWNPEEATRHAELLSQLAPSLRGFLAGFFGHFQYLSMDGAVKCLDRSGLRETDSSDARFGVLGEAADEGVYFAGKLDGADESIYVIDESEKGRVHKAEISAPSIEHFLCLGEASEAEAERALRQRSGGS